MTVVLKALLAGAAALALAGCGAARRDYLAPMPAPPKQWSRGPAAAAVDTARLGDWWTAFQDTTLTSLVTRVTAGNLDVKTAMSRLREARAQVQVSRANRMPSASVGAGTTISRASEESRGGAPIAAGVPIENEIQRNYSFDSDVSWEVDVFGERRSGIDAAMAAADASTLDLQDVLTSAVADTALQYVRVRALQERGRLAAENARLQADTLAIAQFRFQAGLTTELDVYQARTNLESTRAQQAALQLELTQSANALAILIGEPPASLQTLLASSAPVPQARADVGIGVPADALRQRSDVRAAERRLAAQAAQSNVARARLYPRFSLVGSIGLEALDLARLLLPGASFFRAAPAASWNVFDRRQLKQNLAIQGEREVQAGVQYEATVLRALREVEDALAAYAQEQVRRQRLTDAVSAGQLAADLAAQRYNTGLRDFRDVLDAQRSLVSLQDQLASSQANVASAVVRLYRALGGGWQAMPASAP